MKTSWNGREPCIDLGTDRMVVHLDGHLREIPLERTPDGELTPDSAARIRELLQGVSVTGSRTGRRVLCALPCRGAILRTYRLPRVPPSELGALVALQLERDLPLDPAEVITTVFPEASPPGGDEASDTQEVSVVALRRRTLEAPRRLLRECGLEPVFCLGGLAVSRVLGSRAEALAFLDLGRTSSDLVVVERGRPVLLRQLGWGERDLDSAIVESVGVSRGEAAELRRSWNGSILPPVEAAPDRAPVLRDQLESEIRRLGSLVEGALGERARRGALKMMVHGEASRVPGFIDWLEPAGGGERAPELLAPAREPGQTAAIRAMTRALEQSRVSSLGLLEEVVPETEPGAAGRRGAGFWLAACGLVILAIAGLRVTGPLIELARVRGQVEEARRGHEPPDPAVSARLASLERLRSERERRAFLDLLAGVSLSSPPGVLLDSISLDEQGQLILEGHAPSLVETNQMRAVLGTCGLFEPGVFIRVQDAKEGVHFRLTARARPGATLKDFTRPVRESIAGENGKTPEGSPASGSAPPDGSEPTPTSGSGEKLDEAARVTPAPESPRPESPRPEEGR